MSSEVGSSHDETKKGDREYDVEGQRPTISRQISVQLTPEQFERLYLTPGGVPTRQNLSGVIGNPTAIGVAGFLIGMTCFSCDLMGWAHTTTNATLTQVGAFYFTAGVAELVAGIFELIIGNTFPGLVFNLFATFWMSFAFLLSPSQGITAALGGSTAEDYNNGIAIFLIWWSVLVFIIAVGAVRTNAVFFFTFVSLEVTLWILVAIYLNLGKADLNHLQALLKAAGAMGFFTCALGWWLLVALVWGSTGVPIAIPLGDLSNFLTGKKKET